MSNLLCCFDEKRSQYYSQGANDQGADIEKMHLRSDTNGTEVVATFRKSGVIQTSILDIDKHMYSTGVLSNAADEIQAIKKGFGNDFAQGSSDAQNLQGSSDVNVQPSERLSAAASPPSNSCQVDDALQQYILPDTIGDDQEIEEMMKYRNQFESDFSFTKRGIISFIEQCFRDDLAEGDKKKAWELKLNKEDVKVYVKKSGGSPFNQEHTYVKTEVILNSAYSMRKIIESVFDPKHRSQWDKNILKAESKRDGHCELKYQQNRGVMNMNHREFLDKQIRFFEPSSNTFYVYYSALPDGATDYDQREKPAKTDRAYTIIGLQKIERRPQDGKIVYQMLMQCDLQMNVTPKLIALFLPSGMQDWVQKLNKYLANHYDEI